MAVPKKRVAVMLELEAGFQRHTEVFSGILDDAQNRNWEVIIDEYADDTLPVRRVKKAIPYDGIIARATPKLAERSGRLGVPVVNVWLNSRARKKLPGVFPDYEACGRLRAEHLLSRGLMHFAALTSREVGQVLELHGFVAELSAAGHPCVTATAPLSPSMNLSNWRKTERVIDSWMDRFDLPIGVYVGGDDVGRVVVQMCRSRGWRVPEDVAIVAGWNEQAFCERPAPSLTSVDLGTERVGREAARLLQALMDGDPPPTRHLLLPPRGLVVRESTDFFSVQDDQVAAALRFIAANFHRRIGPAEVAKAAGVHVRTLQNRFGACLNRPIATEIRRVRLERAKRELVQGDRPLSEIARDVGFGPAMRMYETFRRELGVTPSAYRKRQQEAAGTARA